jgi:predicted RNase H-like nuclease (RuvC/YqgF family)
LIRAENNTNSADCFGYQISTGVSIIGNIALGVINVVQRVDLQRSEEELDVCNKNITDYDELIKDLKKKAENLEKENEDMKEDNEALSKECYRLKQEFDYESQHYISCRLGTEALETFTKDNSKLNEEVSRLSANLKENTNTAIRVDATVIGSSLKESIYDEAISSQRRDINEQDILTEENKFKEATDGLKYILLSAAKRYYNDLADTIDEYIEAKKIYQDNYLVWHMLQEKLAELKFGKEIIALNYIRFLVAKDNVSLCYVFQIMMIMSYLLLPLGIIRFAMI